MAKDWLSKLGRRGPKRGDGQDADTVEGPPPTYLFPKSPETPWIPMDEDDVREMDGQLADACRAAGVPVMSFDDLAAYGRECREKGIDPMTGEPITDDERDARVREALGRFVEHTRRAAAGTD